MIIAFLLIPALSFSQNSESILIVSYNVENLFDYYDDPETLDEEFLPGGVRRWTKSRFEQKCRRIYQALAATANPNFPTIIGLCEIENQYVLDQLLRLTPLGNMGYRSVHKESPDRRGIDVALLYREHLFEPITYKTIPVIDPYNESFKTRDILYVSGILCSDTVHFFVNHWPSKYGGAVDTKPLRELAAKTLKMMTDSILNENSNGKLILMGDFNDAPADESVEKVLGAKNYKDPSGASILNLFYDEKGSNKYQNKWEPIDQIMVSNTLLADSLPKVASWGVFEASFLLTDDKNYLGKKPFRTYNGFRYEGGFSDHLPVFLTLQIR